MEEKGINVLMVGGRRAGKTSMLAGLIEVMLGDDIKKLVNVADVTEGKHDSLMDKIGELKSELLNNEGKVVMDNKSPTDKFHPYTLEISIPNSGHATQITFTDVNGEYYTNAIKTGDDNAIQYKKSREQLIDNCKKSDVILVAIDTPFLMEGSEAQNLRANCVDDIKGLFTELKMEDKAKLVVFVPIKCEKWAHNHRLDEVTAKVENVYGKILDDLKKSPLMQILILPVQTVGSMEFKEFLSAYIYTGNGRPRHCSAIEDDTMLRFADGSTKFIEQGDVPNINEDPEAVFLGTNIERPNTWFEVTSSQYSPKNCEQLAYHILRYTLDRTTDAIKVENAQRRDSSKQWRKWVLGALAVLTGAIWLYIVAAVAFIWRSKLGDISTTELEALVNKLSTEGYIKDSGDGIKVLKTYQRLKTKN